MTTAVGAVAPARGRWQRHRSSVFIAIGLVAAVAVVLIAGAQSSRTGFLDPDNPDPNGARAVARVLADQGVRVDVVRDADALARAEVDARTTVLVTSVDLLGQTTIDQLLLEARDATVVLTDPGPGTTQAFGVDELPMGVQLDEPRSADCADPTYDGLAVAVDQALAYPVPGGCFDGDDGALLVEPRPGLVLLGAGELLTNDQVLRADNAAVALRLLGGNDRLVWYVPSLDDLTGDDGVSLATLLPTWLRPALWLGAICMIAVLVWRVRRLGPLATEPLPVVVKAIETTRSRGRLYRKAGDRAHAAATLRTAARVSASDRLGLGTHPDPSSLVRDLVHHTGRPVGEIEDLLGPNAPIPTTDHDLITLADRLAQLDREVRRP